jgi:tRNA U34 2-thiouridine synthase MnmA/TrmU
VGATLHTGGNGSVDVCLAAPVQDTAPGQAPVFYQGELLLGGIIATEQPEDSVRSAREGTG